MVLLHSRFAFFNAPNRSSRRTQMESPRKFSNPRGGALHYDLYRSIVLIPYRPRKGQFSSRLPDEKPETYALHLPAHDVAASNDLRHTGTILRIFANRPRRGIKNFNYPLTENFKGKWFGQ